MPSLDAYLNSSIGPRGGLEGVKSSFDNFIRSRNQNIRALIVKEVPYWKRKDLNVCEKVIDRTEVLRVTNGGVNLFKKLVELFRVNGGYAVIKQEKLAECVGLKSRTYANECLKTLKKLGFIKYFPRHAEELQECRDGQKRRKRLASAYFLTRNLFARLKEAFRNGSDFIEPEPDAALRRGAESAQNYKYYKDEYGKTCRVAIFPHLRSETPPPEPPPDDLRMSDDFIYRRFLLQGEQSVVSLLRGNGLAEHEINRKVREFQAMREANPEEVSAIKGAELERIKVADEKRRAEHALEVKETPVTAPKPALAPLPEEELYRIFVAEGEEAAWSAIKSSGGTLVAAGQKMRTLKRRKEAETEEKPAADEA